MFSWINHCVLNPRFQLAPGTVSELIWIGFPATGQNVLFHITELWSDHLSAAPICFPLKTRAFFFFFSLLFMRPLNLSTTCFNTYYVEQLYPWAVYFTCISLMQSSAQQMGSRVCGPLGRSACAKPWNNNTNIYIRSQFFPTLFILCQI